MHSAVANLKQRYGRGRVRIPAATPVRLEDGSSEILAESAIGPVRGWEVMTRADGRKLEVLVVTVNKRRLRVAASRVETLPEPPPVRFPRLRPSDLAD
jgi:hypothetical protein